MISWRSGEEGSVQCRGPHCKTSGAGTLQRAVMEPVSLDMLSLPLPSCPFLRQGKNTQGLERST